MTEEQKAVEEKVELPEVTHGGKEDDIKVEIVSDTPPEDRGRKPLPKEVLDDLENDNLEEYSEKVKKRISQAKKAYHDERRVKEQATREKEQALEIANRLYQENRILKQKYGQGEKVFISEMTKAATTEVEVAKNKLKEAYEDGDPGKLADAQEALTEAKLKLREVQGFKPSLQEEDAGVQQVPQQPQRAPVQRDTKAEAWREKNEWFGTNKGMTAFALGLHEELVENGIDTTSDEYYDRIDRAMKKHFPDEFEGETTEERQEKPTPRKQPNTVVAPATRSTAPRQVRLNESELALAKKFGLTPEQYAREKIKLEMSNNG